jgi:hypothetical protein
MEKAELGKKQYWVLLAISIAVSFVLPLAFGLMINYRWGPFGNLVFVNSVILAIEFLPALNWAVLLYAALRCRFARCLPFVAGYILEYLIMLYFSFTVVQPTQILANISACNFIIMLLFFALQFAYIGLTKGFAKLTKNEAVTILLALLCIFVLNMLTWEITYIVGRIFYPVAGESITALPGGMIGTLHKALYELCKCAIAAVAYLLLKLLFEKSARTGLLLFFKKIGNTAKKLWSATAK